MAKKGSDSIFYTCAPTVFVRDLDTAHRFYTEVLKFRELRRIGDKNILLGAPGITLLLRRRGTPDAPVEPTTMLLGLMVHDVASAMRELSQKGVEFEGDIVDTPLARVAFFSDPDGTSLYLCQWI
jgi:catechol 2,3-dioxygenase-like lactoylglutathione lyase family enzyme